MRGSTDAFASVTCTAVEELTSAHAQLSRAARLSSEWSDETVVHLEKRSNVHPQSVGRLEEKK